jgi:hypothetical protein
MSRKSISFLNFIDPDGEMFIEAIDEFEQSDIFASWLESACEDGKEEGFENG